MVYFYFSPRDKKSSLSEKKYLYLRNVLRELMMEELQNFSMQKR